MNKEFANTSSSPTEYPPYIYISRKDATYRYVENEEELIKALKPFRFQAYILTHLPFAEKVKLFHSAKVIISITGDGLNNYAFYQPGTKVV